jgi:hypothetical protein
MCQNMIRPFAQNPVIPHVANKMRQIIIVDQLRITENPRLLPKQLLDLLPMQLHLSPEFLPRIQKRQRVVIRFIKKFDAPGAIQLLQRLNHFRRMLLALLKNHTAQAKGNAKPPVIPPHRLQQRFRRRQIAFRRHLPADLRILVIVKIMTIRVEHAVSPQPIRLMDLEIKTNRGHATPFVSVRRFPKPADILRAKPEGATEYNNQFGEVVGAVATGMLT